MNREINETSGISRRNFLKGAAFAGAAAMGVGALAGCSDGTSATQTGGGTSNASDAGKTDDFTRYADGWVDTPNTAPIPPVDPPAAWDKEADVVIVGGSGGGLMAAFKLAKEGFSVVLIEKADVVGGSTGEAMLWSHLGGVEKIWGDWGRFGTPYSLEATYDGMMATFEYGMNPQMLRAMLTAGPKAVDAALETGIELVDYMWHLYGESVNSGLIVPTGTEDFMGTGQQPICNALRDSAEAEGAEILYLTPAKTLVVSDGRVIGVVATSGETGEDVFLHGTKAVLFTAGGIGCNRDMLLRYTPFCGVGAATSTLMPTTTGECTRMGLALGAGITGIDTFSVRDGGIEPPEGSASMFRSMFDGGEALFRQPWFGFNARGERLHYFTTDTPDMQKIGHAEKYTCMSDMSTFGNRRIVVFDGDYEERVKVFNESGARTLYDPAGAKKMPELQKSLSKAVNDADWREGLERGLEVGYIKKADTLEDLAVQLGLHPDVAAKAIDEWNTICEKGEDNPTWGYESKWLFPIKTPPFYGAKVSAAVQGTGAGLLINTDMQVLTEDGEVIPGLYAGWQTAGGFGPGHFNDMGMYGGAGSSFTGGFMAYEGILANER
jgi:hypothetical protein